MKPPPQPSTPERNVLTQHNDPQRTGAYLAETILTPNSIQSDNLGLLYKRDVVGFIVAQPLYVENVKVPFTNGYALKDLVIVATSQNHIYAFDAQSTDFSQSPNAGVVWHTPLPETAQLPQQFQGCPTTVWPVGITGTPVIDPDTQTLYVVAMDRADAQFLHAINIGSGQDKGRIEIQWDAGDPKHPEWNFGEHPTDSKQPYSYHLNRPGLLLMGNTVFIAFGSRCDSNGDGWVFAYTFDDTGGFSQVGHFATTVSPGQAAVSGGMASIWQSGSGLVGSPSGDSIFFMTGNGPVKFAQSFVKLAIGHDKHNIFTSVSHFTPTNFNPTRMDSDGDVDLGSGGPVYLPGGRIIGGGKQGRYYVLDANSQADPIPLSQNVSGSGNTGDNNCLPDPSRKLEGFQAFCNLWHLNKSARSKPVDPFVKEAKDLGVGDYGLWVAELAAGYISPSDYDQTQFYGPNIHSAPLFWKADGDQLARIYGTAEKEGLKVFHYNLQTLHVDENPAIITHDTLPGADGPVLVPDGMPGGALSLSANQGKDGIVWGVFPTEDALWANVESWLAPRAPKARMLAFDALTLESYGRTRRRRNRSPSSCHQQ